MGLICVALRKRSQRVRKRHTQSHASRTHSHPYDITLAHFHSLVCSHFMQRPHFIANNRQSVYLIGFIGHSVAMIKYLLVVVLLLHCFAFSPLNSILSILI